MLIDASKMGTTVKENGSQRTKLSNDDIYKIVGTFHNRLSVDDFAVSVTYSDIEQKNYSFSAGQYFDIKIEYRDVTEAQFKANIAEHKKMLSHLFKESDRLAKVIVKKMEGLNFTDNKNE